MKFFLCALLTLSTQFGYAKLPKVEPGEPLPSDLFVELAKLINPAVVNINTTQLPKVQPQRGYRGNNDPYRDFLEQFFGGQMPYSRQPSHSLGTGFIIREDGLIITNNHVIEKADMIKVQLDEKDEKSYEATVIGRDKRTDLALLKINVGKKLPFVKLGSSGVAQVGEWVAAFGNPYGHGHTMTKGIISAKGRDIRELNQFSFIQTDASINPGNSGGPLVNVRGEVIGVNTAIDARAQGIGFTIPIDDVKKILPDLEKKGRVKRGYIGVNIANLTPRIANSLQMDTLDGCLITDVLKGGPAAKAGIKPYDVIVEFNKMKVKSAEDLALAVQDTIVNQSAKLKVERNGKIKNLTVTVLENPEDKNTKDPKQKIYQGQKAPFNLGFKVTNYSAQLAKRWGLPRLKRPRPIVAQVINGSPASRSGLSAGDIILDVNRKETRTSKDVLKRLRPNRFNLLRVLRGNQVLLIQLEAK